VPLTTITATWPLLLGMGVLMLGAGLQSTLLGLRATLDGFPTLVTGIVMWIPEKMPRSFHWVLPIMVFIHSAVALITIAAFMIHVYMSIWVTPGSMQGMVEGTVPSAWAKTHHRLWWQRITGRKN